MTVKITLACTECKQRPRRNCRSRKSPVKG